MTVVLPQNRKLNFASQVKISVLGETLSLFNTFCTQFYSKQSSCDFVKYLNNAECTHEVWRNLQIRTIYNTTRVKHGHNI